MFASFVISFVTKNLQLIFRYGFYDMDNLLANTLGGPIGLTLFISAAYVVTHPDWGRELFSSGPDKLPTQYLDISARNLPQIQKRLHKHDIEIGPYEQDPYTGQRRL